MAYQPKSYKKFVATAATATLVASAIAPAVSAASFSDVADRYKDAVNYITEKGYAQGYPNGKFGTDDNIKRQDAAIMIARALGAKADGDYPKAGFTDVRADAQWAVNFLADKKIVSGKAAGKFGANDFMTRGEMAKVIANAYNLKGDPNNAFPFTDVSDTFKEYVDALQEAGVAQGLTATKFGTGDNVTRGQFALFVYRAEAPGDVSLASVKPTGASDITVEFNKAVDTTKAKFEVKKGNVTVNVSKVTFSEDKKTAQLKLASKFFEGDYTVNVTGLSDQALTSSFKVENEKVAKIEILSDIAPLAADAKTATVGYRVSNQYGEDITSSPLASAIQWNSTTGSASDNDKGVVTINAEGFKVGDTAVVTGINSGSATVATATVKISNQSVADVVNFKGIYNKDNKELVSTSTLTDFPLLVEVKDQYGNALKAADVNSGVIFTSSNPGLVTVDKAVDSQGANKNEIGLQLKAGDNIGLGGSAVITAITKSTGKVTQYTVNVKAASKLDTFSISAPAEIVAANDTVKIPFTAADQYGNTLTKYDDINGQVSFSATGNDTPVLKKDNSGNAYLEYKPTTKGIKVIFATTGTGKVSQLQLDVKDAAQAVTIESLKDVSTTLAVGGKADITYKNVVVKDQYGRDFKLVNNFDNYKLVVSETADNDTVSVGATKELTTDKSVITVSGAKTGTESLTFSLQKKDDKGVFQTVTTSPITVDFKVTDKSAFTSYEVGDVATVYADAKTGEYTRTLKVYGVTSSGEKVLIPTANYTVTSSNAALSYDSATGKLDVKDGVDVAKVFGDNSEIKSTLTIVVDADKAPVTLTKEVTLSNVAPKAAEVEFDSDLLTGGMGTVATTDLNNVNTDATALSAVLDLVDQYGESYTAKDIKITVTNVNDVDKSGAISVTNNGTSTVDIEGVTVGDTFVATYLIDGKVGTLTFRVVAPSAE